jgi:hypothetical protein
VNLNQIILRKNVSAETQRPEHSYGKEALPSSNFFDILKNEVKAAGLPEIGSETRLPDAAERPARDSASDRMDAKKEAGWNDSPAPEHAAHDEKTEKPREQETTALKSGTDEAKSAEKKTEAGTGDGVNRNETLQKKPGLEEPHKKETKPKMKPMENDWTIQLSGILDGISSLLSGIKKDEAGQSKLLPGHGEQAGFNKSAAHDAQIKKLMEAIKSSLDRIDLGNIEKKGPAGLRESIAGIREIITRMNSAKNRGPESQLAARDQSLISELKEAHVKIETIAGALKNEKFDHSFKHEFGEAGANSGSSRNGSARSADAGIIQRGIPFREHLNEIIENARITVKDGQNGTFHLRLHPKELGVVRVNLGLEQGVVHGRFLVESQEAKELIMSNLSAVREQLTEAGISVGEFQVNVSDHSNRSFGEKEDSGNAAAVMNEQFEEILAEYESNAAALHNGSINLII